MLMLLMHPENNVHVLEKDNSEMYYEEPEQTDFLKSSFSHQEFC